MTHVIPFGQRSNHSAQPESPAWSPLTRIAFRFTFTYLALSVWFWIFEFADKSTALVARPYQALWRPFAQWAAWHVFHWSGPVEPNFVCDTRYLYALLACFLAASALIAAVWSVWDRKQGSYLELDRWMRTLLRYSLAYLLLHYGMDKVFLLQFPAPGLARLTERFGDYSPSSLMWAFIGSSLTYTVFGGVAEVLAALLLLFRRTSTFGALIGFAVMFNVTVMVFSYDVAVKMFCLNILLMASYLILPDVGRLLNFFILNRATEPAALPKMLGGRLDRPLGRLIKVAIILFLLVPLTVRDWKNYRSTGAGAPLTPLYGLYEVKDFTLDGVEHPPLLTDNVRWRYVILEEPHMVTLRKMDDSTSTYRMNLDPAQHSISVDAAGETVDKSVLVLTSDGTDRFALKGTWGGVPVAAELKRIDRSNFMLVNRGFHWINERPFVR